MNKLLSGAAVCLTASYWIKKHFPPEEMPHSQPTPGNKILGYMGCPQSKIEDVCKRKRLLFYAPQPDIAQNYALCKTSWISRITGKDRPVVLQLEIEKEHNIQENELWRDPNLSKQFVSPIPIPISMWPALPPKTQEKYDIKVRVHHVVNCKMQQKGGFTCRALHTLSQKINNRFYAHALSHKEKK